MRIPQHKTSQIDIGLLLLCIYYSDGTRVVCFLQNDFFDYEMPVDYVDYWDSLQGSNVFSLPLRLVWVVRCTADFGRKVVDLGDLIMSRLQIELARLLQIKPFVRCPLEGTVV